MESIKKTKETLTTESFAPETIKSIEKNLEKIEKELKTDLSKLDEKEREKIFISSKENWQKFVSVIENPLLRIKISHKESSQIETVLRGMRFTSDKEISSMVEAKPTLAKILTETEKSKETEMFIDLKLDEIAKFYYFFAQYASCSYDEVELYHKLIGIFQKPLADFNSFSEIINALSKQVTSHFFQTTEMKSTEEASLEKVQ